jgi:hypothetical protein
MALEHMEQIHGVPALAVNWSCDQFELVRDGLQDESIKRLIEDLIGSGFVYIRAKVINDQ